MGSLPTEELPRLTPLEQIGPRGYLRYIFPFQLRDGYDQEEVTHILRRGFEAACRRFPTLAAECVSEPGAKQANATKLQKIPNGDIENIVVKDLRNSDAFPMTYSDLKAKSFPCSAFNADILCRCSVWTAPGERAPVSLIQLNYIRGGLILNWCVYHMVGDGKTFYTWTRVWAEECRRAQGLDVPSVELPGEIFTDRAIVMNAKSPSDDKCGRLEDHPEYTVMTDPASQMQKLLACKDHVGQIFYFSPEALSRMKNDAYPPSRLSSSDPKYVSTNDALSALVWRSIMAAQFPLETLEDDPVSTFAIAIDGRLRMDPPIHPDTIGCFLEYLNITMPLREMLTTASLADIAMLVRKAILHADTAFRGGFTNDVVALANKLDNVGLLAPTGFLDMPGLSCVQTSWAKFELYGLDWGNALGQIEAIRSPSEGVISGAQILLPELPDGGREVLVGIEERYLGRLMQDPVWGKYAVAR